MKAKKTVVFALLGILLLAVSPTCGVHFGSLPPDVVVEKFITASESLDAEKLASYYLPELRRIFIEGIEYGFQGIKAVSNYGIHTEIISEGKYTAEVFAEWHSRTEYYDGSIEQENPAVYFSLDKRDGDWLISMMDTEDGIVGAYEECEADKDALQIASLAYYHDNGAWLATYAVMIPQYINKMPDSDTGCDWGVSTAAATEGRICYYATAAGAAADACGCKDAAIQCTVGSVIDLNPLSP